MPAQSKARMAAEERMAIFVVPFESLKGVCVMTVVLGLELFGFQSGDNLSD